MEDKKEKKPFNPIWYMVIAFVILIVPAAVYIGFLIPQMKEEYIILMSSGGAIGGAGMFGASMIPEKVKYGGLFKTAARSFTLLVVTTLIKDFMSQILGLIAVIIVCVLIFMFLRGVYKDAKQNRANKQLAEEIARGITESTK